MVYSQLDNTETAEYLLLFIHFMALSDKRLLITGVIIYTAKLKIEINNTCHT